MPRAPLDLRDTVFLSTQKGDEIEFSVVALLEDERSKQTFAVLLNDPDDGEERFIVTDAYGALIENDDLAQQVLDDYLQYDASEESGPEL